VLVKKWGRSPKLGWDNQLPAVVAFFLQIDRYASLEGMFVVKITVYKRCRHYCKNKDSREEKMELPYKEFISEGTSREIYDLCLHWRFEENNFNGILCRYYKPPAITRLSASSMPQNCGMIWSSWRGVNANKDVNINFTWRGFVRKGRLNPHGWGIGWYLTAANGKRSASLIKQPIPAYKSKIALTLPKLNIWSQVIISHVRYATSGINYLYLNTHPFVRKIWSVW